MEALLGDLRFAMRQLRRSPVFAAAAILTLAVSIGAATAMFSVVNGVLLKPLQYSDSGRLVAVWERVRFLEALIPYVGPNPRHEDVWRRENRSFADIALLQQRSTGVRAGGEHPLLTGVIRTQPNLLRMLGARPALGRDFLPGEAVKGHEAVAILTWPLWQQLFPGDAHVLGRTVVIGDAPYQIVGVLPKEFYFPKTNELTPGPVSRDVPAAGVLTPLVVNPEGFGWNSDYGNYVALARLKPGVTADQAQQDLDALTARTMRQGPAEEVGPDPGGAVRIYLQPLKEVIAGRSAARLWLLLAAVLSLLLLACVNLANAQLARQSRRGQELALRSALGATAMQLLRITLAEVLLLTIAGGTLGVALAFVTVRYLSGWARVAVPRTGEVQVSLPVLGVALLLTLGVTAVLGLLPALRVLHLVPTQAIADRGRMAGTRHAGRTRLWLVGVQVFGCTALLLVAGLFTRSLVHLSSFDRGFSAQHVVAAEVYLQGKALAADAARNSFNDGVLAKLRALPGVQSATVGSFELLAGESWIDGVHIAGQSGTPPEANFRWIGPDYFTTLQQRLKEGRQIEERDRSAKVAVISSATAAAVWPGQSALGRQFRRNETTYTVVGVVADAYTNSLTAAPPNMVYLPYWDNPQATSYFMVRGDGDAAALSGAVREAIWAYNPAVTIALVRALEGEVQDSLAPEHLQTYLLAAFGGAALLVAMLGIYGVLSYSVEERRREIGIRMALGATRRAVCGLVVWSVVPVVMAGAATGVLASMLAGKALRALLYGAVSTAPVGLAVVSLLAATAAVAAAIPCLRAARVEPMEALRTE